MTRHWPKLCHQKRNSGFLRPDSIGFWFLSIIINEFWGEKNLVYIVCPIGLGSWRHGTFRQVFGLSQGTTFSPFFWNLFYLKLFIYIIGLGIDRLITWYFSILLYFDFITFPFIDIDVRTNKPKAKLYKDEEGNFKGDGLCTYVKVESVQLGKY